MDAYLNGCGVAYDDPRARAVLRRDGAQEERARDADAELRDHMPGHGALGDRGLQPRVHAWWLVHRQPRSTLPERYVVPEGRREDQRVAPRAHDPGVRLHDVPDDVCDHYARADRRRIRRPYEILGDAVVHGIVVASYLFAYRAHDVGAVRLLGSKRCARFRRWHGRAHQRRYCGPGLRSSARQADRLRQGG